MTKEEFEKLSQEEQNKYMIYNARETYFYLLEGSLKEWAMLSKEEKKKMDRLIKAIVAYQDFIIQETLNK